MVSICHHYREYRRILWDWREWIHTVFQCLRLWNSCLHHTSNLTPTHSAHFNKFSYYSPNYLSVCLLICTALNNLGTAIKWFAGANYTAAVFGQTLLGLAQGCTVQVPAGKIFYEAHLAELNKFSAFRKMVFLEGRSVGTTHFELQSLSGRCCWEHFSISYRERWDAECNSLLMDLYNRD